MRTEKRSRSPTCKYRFQKSSVPTVTPAGQTLAESRWDGGWYSGKKLTSLTPPALRFVSFSGPGVLRANQHDVEYQAANQTDGGRRGARNVKREPGRCQIGRQVAMRPITHPRSRRIFELTTSLRSNDNSKIATFGGDLTVFSSGTPCTGPRGSPGPVKCSNARGFWP